MVMMSRQQQQRWMKRSTIILIMAAGLVLLLGLLLPVKTMEAEPGKSGAVVPTATAAAGATNQGSANVNPKADLAGLQKLANYNWRRPVFGDAADEEFMAGDGTGRAMSLKLVGVVVEPGHSMALFQKPDGSVEVCPVGQMVDDSGGKVKVTKVEVDRAVVVFGGVTQTLMVPMQTEGLSAMSAGGAGNAMTTGGATVGTSVGTTRRPLPPEVQKRLDEIRAKRAMQKAGGNSATSANQDGTSSPQQGAKPTQPMMINQPDDNNAANNPG